MFDYDPKKIRNFSIIAHIDHGKSTLADRLLELTETVSSREMKEQLLDSMQLERDKGITIKARPATMLYKANDGTVYQFNLIDTPGHVDFSYEVSRSLAACEGALLVVDATQGVQAQTIANVFLAIERDLEIIPVINKIDMPTSDVEAVKEQIEEVIGLDANGAFLISAKTGEGVAELLEAIVSRVPAPKPAKDNKLKALIFDSHYDPYRGVMVYTRVLEGKLESKELIHFMSGKKQFESLEVGIFSPFEKPVSSLRAGEVGYFTAGIKDSNDVHVGDTVTHAKHPTSEALPGFKIIQPVVFAGIYPLDSTDFEALKDALGKLKLNDSALTVEQDSSHALGFGFRCGFLGLLHLEIVIERLRMEYDLDTITTAPSVVYFFHQKSGEVMQVDNPVYFPDPTTTTFVEEPWIRCTLIAPSKYMGALMSLAMEKRGELVKTESSSGDRLLLTFHFPMNEILTDFNDRLKSITQGYASFDYELSGYKKSEIIKLEIKVNDEVVDSFSCLVHRSKAEARGRAICKKLKEVIPRQLFKIAIQAAIGGKIIARENISALSKNVTAKCYGGDITRKRKLWEKQKKGKERMRKHGNVHIPHDAFMEVLKVSE
jgi:GTP-binding protein LepA